MARSTSYSEPLSIDSLTPINLSALARVVREYGNASGVFYKIDAPATPHVKRAIRAGAVEPAGAPGHWRLSAAGRAAIHGAGLAGLAGAWREYGMRQGEPILMHRNNALRVVHDDGAFFLQEPGAGGWVNVRWAKSFRSAEAAMEAGEDGGPSF